MSTQFPAASAGPDQQWSSKDFDKCTTSSKPKLCQLPIKHTKNQLQPQLCTDAIRPNPLRCDDGSIMMHRKTIGKKTNLVLVYWVIAPRAAVALRRGTVARRGCRGQSTPQLRLSIQIGPSRINLPKFFGEL